MLVLVLGYRKGLCQALESLSIDYLIWHTKEIKTARDAKEIIVGDYPKTHDEFNSRVKSAKNITHVISGTEDSVFPGSLVRSWLGAKRNPLSIAVKCTDKLKMKIHLFENGIPMTPFLSKKMVESPDQIIKDLGPEVIVKPRKSSGGRGLKKIAVSSEIQKELDHQSLVEKVIEGSEGSVESIIENGKIVFFNITEYKKNGILNHVPSHYSESIKSEIQFLNESVIGALKIKWGMTHLEFYRTKEGLLFGEIALRPPGGYIMDALEIAYDHNIWDLLVKVELGIPTGPLPELKKYSCSYILYPKVGKVVEIKGEAEVRKLKSFKKLRVKAKLEQKIKERTGLGDDLGYGLFAHESKQQLLDDLKVFKKTFKIETKEN